jgi:hypothetical protein
MGLSTPPTERGRRKAHRFGRSARNPFFSCPSIRLNRGASAAFQLKRSVFHRPRPDEGGEKPTASHRSDPRHAPFLGIVSIETMHWLATGPPAGRLCTAGHAPSEAELQRMAGVVDPLSASQATDQATGALARTGGARHETQRLRPCRGCRVPREPQGEGVGRGHRIQILANYYPILRPIGLQVAFLQTS